MKKYLNYKSYIFLSCIIYILLYSFLLIKIDELFNGAYEIGDIFYRLCFAYTTGFIFYILVTYLPKKADKKNIYYFADSKKAKIITSFENFLDEILKEIDNVLKNEPNSLEEGRRKAMAMILLENETLDKKNLTKNDFKSILQLINPNHNSPFNSVVPQSHNQVFLQPILWRDQFKMVTENIRKQILEMFTVMPHLSTKHVRALTELLDSDYVDMTQNTQYFHLSSDLEFLHEPMYEFYKLMQSLKKIGTIQNNSHYRAPHRCFFNSQ